MTHLFCNENKFHFALQIPRHSERNEVERRISASPLERMSIRTGEGLYDLPSLAVVVHFVVLKFLCAHVNR